MHVDISALTSICYLFVLYEKNVFVTEGASSLSRLGALQDEGRLAVNFAIWLQRDLL